MSLGTCIVVLFELNFIANSSNDETGFLNFVQKSKKVIILTKFIRWLDKSIILNIIYIVIFIKVRVLKRNQHSFNIGIFIN